MRIVLWDTRKLDVAKDFAGGFGVGQYPGGGGIPGRIDSPLCTSAIVAPWPWSIAYLAAIFRDLGHQVEYALDRVPAAPTCTSSIPR